MSNGVSMYACTSFAPLVDSESKILILGSMPGVKSLTEQEYYAHPRNRFWQLLALLLGEDNPADYVAKKAMLKKHRIALWDTLGYCERKGSLDSDIKGEVPNDICGLLGQYPHIQAVFCNGGKAAAACKKYFVKSLSRPVHIYYLPSTSPANARKNLAALEVEWRIILDYLH